MSLVPAPPDNPNDPELELSDDEHLVRKKPDSSWLVPTAFLGSIRQDLTKRQKVEHNGEISYNRTPPVGGMEMAAPLNGDGKKYSYRERYHIVIELKDQESVASTTSKNRKNRHGNLPPYRIPVDGDFNPNRGPGVNPCELQDIPNPVLEMEPTVYPRPPTPDPIDPDPEDPDPEPEDPGDVDPHEEEYGQNEATLRRFEDNYFMCGYFADETPESWNYVTMTLAGVRFAFLPEHDGRTLFYEFPYYKERGSTGLREIRLVFYGDISNVSLQDRQIYICTVLRETLVDTMMSALTFRAAVGGEASGASTVVICDIDESKLDDGYNMLLLNVSLNLNRDRPPQPGTNPDILAMRSIYTPLPDSCVFSDTMPDMKKTTDPNYDGSRINWEGAWLSSSALLYSLQPVGQFLMKNNPRNAKIPPVLHFKSELRWKTKTGEFVNSHDSVIAATKLGTIGTGAYSKYLLNPDQYNFETHTFDGMTRSCAVVHHAGNVPGKMGHYTRTCHQVYDDQR